MTKFHFDSTYDSKEISISVTSIINYAFDDVTDFEIDITRYLGNEKFFLQMKKLITHHGLIYGKKSFCKSN